VVSPFVSSQAGDDLLALFYEPPVEQVAYRWEPRLVENVPSFSAGDVVTRLVSVPVGGRYVDEANVIHINEGPDALTLPQLSVTFNLKPDLQWSDGVALTSEDVVLGYHLAQDSQVSGQWRELVERTDRFRALDDHTLRWEGVPGYLSRDYPSFIYPPQPAHRWRGKPLSEILQDLTPPGTGPFDIVAWERGREVRLRPNPYYGGVEAIQLAEIIVRFPQESVDAWPQLLAEGVCDIVLSDPAMSVTWDAWADLLAEKAAILYADVSPDSTFMRLDFNLAPLHAQAPLLSQRRVRLALAYCINRVHLATASPDQGLVPAEGFLPPGHPAFDTETLDRIEYNPEKGRALLNAAGWYDGNGDNLREAHGVEGIPEGQPLTLTLHLAPQYILIAAHLSTDLSLCGVGIEPQPTEAQILYAADAASPLFGRTFDLALFGWQAEAPLVCGAWRSDRIPTPENGWQGENFSGYTSEVYDDACERALTSVRTEVQWEALRQSQALLTHDLPTLFLAWRPTWFVARPEVQGLQADGTAPGTLWNAEALSLGQATLIPTDE
jgi:peptide/nickel transport system substrate-binding protein